MVDIRFLCFVESHHQLDADVRMLGGGQNESCFSSVQRDGGVIVWPALQDHLCGNWGIFLPFSLFSPEISPQRLCARFPFFPIFSVVSGESGEKIGYFSPQINHFPKNVPFFATLSPRFSTTNSTTSPESRP